MYSATALFGFAAEFVTLMVAAAGLALVALRSDLVARRPGGRLAMAAGFLLTAVAAFVTGSLLVTDDPDRLVSLGRIAGGTLLLIGSADWATDRPSRRRVWAGGTIWVGAGIMEIAGASTVATGVVLVVASGVVFLALVGASRSSIAAQVTVGSAGTLLLIVLVLAVALSGVISSSLQRSELNRLTTRVHSEAGQLAGSSAQAIKDARFVAADLEGYFRTTAPNPLVQLGASGSPPVAAAAVSDRLNQVAGLYPVGGFVYVDETSNVLAATSGVDRGLIAGVAREPVIAAQSCRSAGVGLLSIAGGRAWAIGAYPTCPTSGSKVLGQVITVTPLDDSYLGQRRALAPTVALALVADRTVVASAGMSSLGAPVLAAAEAAQRDARGSTFASSGQLVAVQALPGLPGQSVGTVVLSSQESALTGTRNSLLRTLFLISLGGTLLALALAAALGDRLTARIRRLTVVAGQIQEGARASRAGIGGRDEVGTLGAAFDAMVDSMEEQTMALRTAAADETRLRGRLEAVVAGMGDGLAATDAAGRITDFNVAAEELTGVSSVDAVGQPVDRILRMTGEDAPAIEQRMRCPGPGRWAALGSVRPQHGADVPVALSVGALRGPDGEVTGGVLVLRDLRREREIERMKTEFLSRVGHELRTPLTGILGYADILLRREVSPERARVWHEEILAGSKRLLRIVEMLEFFASSGAGRILLRPEPVDVATLVTGVVAAWESRLPPTHTLVSRSVAETPSVNADRRWLALALDELIDNAVKFSPLGGRVVISAGPARARSANGATRGWVDLAVTDRGKGMTPDEQAAAFGEFVQGDSSDTRSYGGLGLGLTLVQRVSQGMGGRVTCRSSPGRGSTVIVRLPAGGAGPAPGPGDRTVGQRTAIR